MTEPAPSQPKPASRAAQAAGVVAAAFVPYLPYTKVLSSESNRRLMFYTHEDALALFALIAATIAVFGLAWAALKKVPGRAGTAARRIAVAGAIGLALLNFTSLYHPIGGDFGYYMNYLVLGALTVGIAIWGRTYTVFAVASGVAARFIAPAPIVFLLFLYGADEHPPVKQPAPPHKPATESTPGPVYIFLFDGMDADVAIKDPETRKHAPDLNAFIQHATWFENAESPAHYTAGSVPVFLYQTKGLYKVEDGVYYLERGGANTPTASLQSIFKRLDTGRTFKVCGGWYLDYGPLVGAQVDWLRTCSYSKPEFDSVGQSVLFSTVMASQFGFVPLVRGALELNDFSYHPHAQNTAEMHKHALEVIRDHGDDVVAFFHYPVPHAPYLFDRNGVLPHDKVVSALDQKAYLLNLEYADRLLSELMAALKQTGRWDHATVVVMSDHGQGTKHCVFAVKLPGQESPVTVKDPLNTADFLGWLETAGHPRVRK